MQLNSVVLPAPFGPIRPRISPSFDRERDAVQRDDAAETQRDVADFEQRARATADGSAAGPGRSQPPRRGSHARRDRRPEPGMHCALTPYNLS